MPEVSVEELQKAVERMHGHPATWRKSELVRDEYKGKTVWNGIVQVFELDGHPSASFCYAWSSPVEGSKNRRFFAVLHEPPITSALDAVRAAIVREYQADKP
jgi:hypothetical protein